MPKLTLGSWLWVCLACAALGFSGGWQVHSWKTGSSEARSIKADIKVAQKLTVESDKIEVKKQEQQQAVKIVYRTIRERISNADDNRVCFNSESLSLYNAATEGTDPYRSELIGAARENDAVEATVKQVLENATNNYETCNSNIIKHNALIDKVESLKGRMCVCGE